MIGTELWAITSYFNPVGYRRRIENYHQFRQHLQAPLVTVELSFDGRFELGPEDADVLVQIHGGDVMWQKERLLNLAVERVPAGCRKIAWIDCDVILTREDWPELASRALDDVPLLHLFEACRDLPRDVMVGRRDSLDGPAPIPSVVHRMAVEGVALDEILRRHATIRRIWTNGLAWATRRDLLETHGFYDACVVGGGDRALICAAFGEFESCTGRLRMNPRRSAHYLAWARPYFEAVRGRVGCIPGEAVHLWHGELEDRRYGERDGYLEAFAFDPYRDIALDDHRVWRWSSDKSELHRLVRRYFELRMDDGHEGPSTAVQVKMQDLPGRGRQRRPALDS